MAESMDYPEGEKKYDKKISWVNIDMADNGYVVSWSEKEIKPPGCNDHCDYIDHKKLFSEKEDGAAWDHFKNLKMMEMHYKYDKKMNSGGMGEVAKAPMSY